MHLPCVMPRSCDASEQARLDQRNLLALEIGRNKLTSEHVIQTDFRSQAEFFISNLSVGNGSLALIDAANDGA